MSSTVEEVRARKKKLKEEDPEEFERQIQAQGIAERAAPDPISQDLLDRARRQGINVFKLQNLRRLSEAGQLAEQGQEQAREGVAGGQALIAGAEGEAGIEEARLSKIAGFSLAGGGVLPTTPIDQITKLVTGVENTNKQLEVVNTLSKGTLQTAWGTINVLGRLAGASFDSIVRDQEQVITNTREGMQKLSTEHEQRLRTDEDTISRIADLEADINQALRTAHSASRFSAKAYLEGMDTLEVRLRRAKNDIEASRAKILRTIAQNAITAQAPTDEQILGSLR